MQQQRSDFIRNNLECFYDMPILDAAKILKVSETTVRNYKLTKGFRDWPFVAVKKNEFHLNWDDIERLRANALVLASDEEQEILMCASTRGSLMRRIHATPARPEKRKLMDTDVKGFSDTDEEIAIQPIKPIKPIKPTKTRDPAEFAHTDDPILFNALKYEDDFHITPWTEEDIEIMQGLRPDWLPWLDALDVC